MRSRSGEERREPPEDAVAVGDGDGTSTFLMALPLFKPFEDFLLLLVDRLTTGGLGALILLESLLLSLE